MCLTKMIGVLQRKVYHKAKEETPAQMMLAASALFRVSHDEATRRA
jgi:hypothetical protein